MFKRLEIIDNTIIQKITVLHKPATNKLFILITSLGNAGLVWFAVSLPFLLMKNTRNIGLNILIAILMAVITGEGIIKHIVGRSRPSNDLPDDEQIIEKPGLYSFPSGHTMSSFAAATVVFIYCPVYVWLPIGILASLIGFSRIYLRVHYFTDVVAGMLFGIICGYFSVVLYTKYIYILFK